MQFSEFKNKIYQKFGLDLNSYKENQLKRRLDNLLEKRKIRDYKEFFNLLCTKREEYHNFLDYLTINVTEFFRDPRMFQILETKVVPELLSKSPNLKVWSAACSTGAEPYSVSIILYEKSPRKTYRIDATDLDQSILQKAREGRYKADALKNESKQRLEKYFIRQGDEYIIKQEIKSKVYFKQHDLLADKYPTGYDLILCRNVTIYFTREAQDKINKQFANSLKPGGYLFIGGSETIFNSEKFGLKKVFPCFYRRD